MTRRLLSDFFSTTKMCEAHFELREDLQYFFKGLGFSEVVLEDWHLFIGEGLQVFRYLLTLFFLILVAPPGCRHRIEFLFTTLLYNFGGPSFKLFPIFFPFFNLEWMISQMPRLGML